jgi:hypothetical protein
MHGYQFCFYDKAIKDLKKQILLLHEKLTNERENTRIMIGVGTKKRIQGNWELGIYEKENNFWNVVGLIGTVLSN